MKILLEMFALHMEFLYFYSTTLLHDNEYFNPLKVIRKIQNGRCKNGTSSKTLHTNEVIWFIFTF